MNFTTLPIDFRERPSHSFRQQPFRPETEVPTDFEFELELSSFDGSGPEYRVTAVARSMLCDVATKFGERSATVK